MTANRSGAPWRFATFLAPNMLPIYRFLADQIAHRLGRPVQLVVAAPSTSSNKARPTLA
jgi:hypothetical protein